MKNAMSSADATTGAGYQTPASSSVARAVFDVPTMQRTVSLSPNWVNSRVTFA